MAATRSRDPAALLDVIIAKAPALRMAGVSLVRLGDLEFHVAPPEPPPVVTDDGEREPTDPLNDPLLYGRSRGTPGFGHRSDDDE